MYARVEKLLKMMENIYESCYFFTDHLIYNGGIEIVPNFKFRRIEIFTIRLDYF